MTKNVLEAIFKRDVFKETRRAQERTTPEYLYQYGKRSNYFIIILTGEATIEVGYEKLEFIAGQFAYFGVNALLNESETADQIINDGNKIRQNNYTPDFSLRVDDRCVYFKIDRDLWLNGVKKSRYQMENPEMGGIAIDLNNSNLNNTNSVNTNQSSLAANNNASISDSYNQSVDNIEINKNNKTNKSSEYIKLINDDNDS